jgi:hypothetical protein
VVVQAQLLGVESLIVFHNFIVLTTCFDPYLASSSGHTYLKAASLIFQLHNARFRHNGIKPRRDLVWLYSYKHPASGLLALLVHKI